MRQTNKAVKILALILSTMLLCGASTYGFANDDSSRTSADQTNDTNDIITSINSNITDASDTESTELYKSETVYVIADASGSAQKVIVSDWIKNPNNETTITDSSDLTDIKNVKGSETYSIDENGMKIWDAQGNDIYYQGTSSKSLPVDVSVSYKLDGNDISAEDLAGKSGKVTMRFDFKNNEKQTVTIDGEAVDIYVPFIMSTGLMMKDSDFSNVQVTNGKVINDGTRNIVIGFALPGLQDDLGIDDDVMDIPDYVEVTADTTSFSLEGTLTLATNDVFSQYSYDSSSMKSEIEDKLNDLTSGVQKLVDGSSDLYSGMTTLMSSSDTLISAIDQLTSGSSQVTQGAQDLQSGIEKVDSGTGDLSSGLSELNANSSLLTEGADEVSDGSTKLASGTSDLLTGATKLNSGLSTIYSNNQALTSGAQTAENTAKQIAGGSAQLYQGSTILKNGLSTLDSKSQSLVDGANTLFDSTLDTANTQLTASLLNSGITIPTLTKDNYKTVLESAIASISDENARTLAYNTAYAQVSQQVNSNKDTIEAAVTSSVKKTVLESILNAAGITNTDGSAMSADQYSAAVQAGLIPQATQTQIDSTLQAQMASTTIVSTIAAATQTEIQNQINTAMASSTVTDQINAAVAKAGATRKALSDLETELANVNLFCDSLSQYTAGVNTALNGSADLQTNLSSLSSGSSQLYSGMQLLNGSIVAYTNGVASAYSGSSDLKTGASDLNAGAVALNAGTYKLKTGVYDYTTGLKSAFDGSLTLKDGTSHLTSGSADLADGAKQISDNLRKLLDGTGELKSGVSTLTEGSLSLSDGLKELQTNGITKITDFYNNNIKKLSARLDAVKDVSDSYNTYAGKSADMNGSVKFVYKTAEISADSSSK